MKRPELRFIRFDNVVYVNVYASVINVRFSLTVLQNGFLIFEPTWAEGSK